MLDPHPRSNGSISEPHFVTNTHQKTICIIGAGPAGLACLRTILDSEQYKSASWIPVAFEAREEVGGIWLPAPSDSVDPPLTPLYDCLTTNLPHPIMSFRSYPFPPETPLFPEAEKVHQYFKDFSHHFSLRKHIKLSTHITSVTYTPDKVRRWLIRTSQNELYYFDLIIVCNGHHRVPRYPPIPGLSEWHVAQKISHSVYYRCPISTYKNKSLLIVGCGPSGYDLALDLRGYACKVILTGSNLKNCTDPMTGVLLRPQLLSFGSPTSGAAMFTDGTMEEGIDYCILATGYMFDFPFLQPPLICNEIPMTSNLPLPKELHNASYGLLPLAQHIWPLQTHFPAETMAFVGVITRGTPPPLFESQARAVLRAFDTYIKGIETGSGVRGINEQVEAEELVARWEKLKGKCGNDEGVIKIWHRLGELEMYEYRDHLSSFAETDPFQTRSQSKPGSQEIDILKQVIRVHKWERFGYAEKDIMRRTWVKIEKSGEADMWLKDIGTNGIDDWVDLMNRVVQYGESLESTEAERSFQYV